MIRPRARGPAAAAAVALAAFAFASNGCTRDARGREGDPPKAGAPAGDPGEGPPLDALRLGGDAVAARIGSFAWEGDVTWTVEKPGVNPVRATERHRIRQLATGDFEASAEIDPGGGPGSETGRYVISRAGKVYARGRWAPYRERPTDRGDGARRLRDESFRMAADVVALLGPALAVQPSRAGSFAGRKARRYGLSLGATTTPAAPADASAADAAADAKDPDTARRRAFLEGRVPTAAAGELLVDAATGVPLSLSLRASFTERTDAQLRADVAIEARLTALGHEVAAVKAPPGALPDDRKPKGVARALEAAGLRKRGATTTPGAAPAIERDEDAPDEP